MAKDPAFLFYSQDFIVGTNTMNFEDRGKYITILAQMHQQGRLDEETISFLVGSISVKLKNKFSIDENDLWYNKRLEEESAKRSAFIDSRRENGKKGGRPSKASGKPSAKAKHKLPVNEDENVNDSINVAVYEKLYSSLKQELNVLDKYDDLFLLWFKYKSEKGQTYKKTGMHTLLKNKMMWGADRLKSSINFSIERNYDGLYEKNGKNKFNGSPGTEMVY